jgi:hypothetical protein
MVIILITLLVSRCSLLVVIIVGYYKAERINNFGSVEHTLNT